MPGILRSVLFLILLLALSAPALAGEVKLTLLYSGNTEGEIRPCPT